MQNVIQFRSLLDDLTESEYKQFWIQLVDIISDKKTLSTILFHYFNALHSNHQYEEVTQINDMILELIKQRVPVLPKQQTENTDNHDIDDVVESASPSAITPMPTQPTATIDDLPGELISETMSYLSYCDYLRLQQLDRRMFIISKQLMQIHELPSPFEIERSYYNLTSYFNKCVADCHSNQPLSYYFNFRHIRILHINLEHFSDFCSHRVHVLNHVDKLQIDCSGSANEGVYAFGNPKSVRVSSDNKVKWLYLSQDIDSDCHPYIFKLLIPHFHHLEALQMCQWDQRNEININSWSDADVAVLFPKLKALSLYDDAWEVSDRIVKVIGHQLEHFVVVGYGGTAYSRNGWSELKELVLYPPSRVAIDHIAQSARRIQKLAVWLKATTGMYSDDQMVRSLLTLVQHQVNLRYLFVFIHPSQFQIIWNMILAVNGSPLKLKLNVAWEKESSNETTCDSIRKTIDCMAIATKNNFMLLVTVPRQAEGIQKLFEWISTKLRDDSYGLRTIGEYLVVKSNEYKMFGGYKETWMMWPSHFLE